MSNELLLLIILVGAGHVIYRLNQAAKAATRAVGNGVKAFTENEDAMDGFKEGLLWQLERFLRG